MQTRNRITDDMTNQSTKQRLHTEREKVRHTTHWDLDYLPLEEVENYYFLPPAKKRVPRDTSNRKQMDQRRLGLVLIGIGVGLFAAALALGRFLG